MSDETRVRDAAAPAARVIEFEPAGETAPPRPAAPRVIVTDQAERVTPSEPAAPLVTVDEPPRRRDRVLTWALWGIAVFFAGWLIVDAVGWVSAAFDRGTGLGIAAAAVLAAGLAGAGVLIGREAVSLFRLKSVEALHERFESFERLPPAQARKAIADVLAVVPRRREVQTAIAAFQRQVQLHHTAQQQVEILSRTVLKPLDRHAETHVRTAVLQAFGITAISPTALSDAVFFLACGIRMVRAIAASYGHRPTTSTTVHLLRRLVYEAGKLGAVDIAGSSFAQYLGGAVAERLATSAAESVYASYRMARLGLIVMDLCRPIPFRPDEVPSIGSLVGNAARRRAESSNP
jgi:putative membrane protein